MATDYLSFYQSFYVTPPLWQGSYEGLVQFKFPEIDFEGFDSLPIPQSLRLGHQIEFIFKVLISQSNSNQILIHNLAIDRNKISLGEIDFILQDTHSRALTHIELTYKFYIITRDGTAIDQQLIGPNKRDAFIAKKDRIKQHQLPLLYRPESIKALLESGITVDKLVQQVCFKSQLFFPHDDRATDLGPFNPDCIAGSWISYSDFDSDEFRSSTYYIPAKLEWLLRPHAMVHWKTYEETYDEIAEQLMRQYAPLIWVKNSSERIQKLFILF